MTTNTKEMDIMIGLATSNKCHLIDGKFYYLEDDVRETLTTYASQIRAERDREVVEALTKEHYGISYESDTCIECENHTRIKEALAVITQPNNPK